MPAKEAFAPESVHKTRETLDGSWNRWLDDALTLRKAFPNQSAISVY
jgi:hypothetical protein